MSCPSKKTLVELLDHYKAQSQRYLSAHRLTYSSAAEADKIRELCAAGKMRAALNHFDKVTNLHGVEHIRSRAGKVTYYANTGDSYGTTLLLTGDSLRVGDWASMVERGGYDGADAGLGGAKTSRKASGGSACRSKTGRFIKCRR